MQLFVVTAAILLLLQQITTASLPVHQRNNSHTVLALYHTWHRVVVAGLCMISVLVTMYLSWVRHWSIHTLDGAAVARYDTEAYRQAHIRAQSYWRERSWRAAWHRRCRRQHRLRARHCRHHQPHCIASRIIVVGHGGIRSRCIWHCWACSRS